MVLANCQRFRKAEYSWCQQLLVPQSWNVCITLSVLNFWVVPRSRTRVRIAVEGASGLRDESLISISVVMPFLLSSGA
jgi:hypothetical protein